MRGVCERAAHRLRSETPLTDSTHRKLTDAFPLTEILQAPLTENSQMLPRSQMPLTDPLTERSQRNHGIIISKIPEVAGRCNSQRHLLLSLSFSEHRYCCRRRRRACCCFCYCFFCRCCCSCCLLLLLVAAVCRCFCCCCCYCCYYCGMKMTATPLLPLLLLGQLEPLQLAMASSRKGTGPRTLDL